MRATNISESVPRTRKTSCSVTATSAIVINLIGLVILLAGSWSTAVLAQNVASPTAPSAQPAEKDVNTITDFRPLFEEREAIITQLRGLEQSLDELTTKVHNLPPADKVEQYLRTARSDLARLKKASSPDAEKIDSVQRYVDSAEEDLKAAQESAPKLQEMKADQERKRRRLFVIEQRIASLFDATKDVNHFRTNATYTFGVLVFLVVLGFYCIAWYKDGVAATIFAGELGMQFITLFLIVIAIILFGIMGTLEGRELAALLGGLSGYILGRAERKTAPIPKPPTTETQTQT